MTLRILHVVRSDDFAGVEQFVRRLAVAQSSRHRVTVIGGDSSQMAELLGRSGVRYRPSGSLMKLAATVRAGAPHVDVVNTHMTDADIAGAVGLLGVRDRPALVATRHFSRRRGSTGPGVPYRLVERRVDAEIAVSQAVAASIDVPSTIVHPGVEPRAERRSSHGERVVLMAQRLQPEKHSEVGLRAFAMAGLAASGWMLHIAGEGTEKASLARLAGELGIGPYVRFLGFRDDVPTLMESAGILLATSPFEHFGLTVLEAMATGLPVVATAGGGHVEMLGEVPGALLFPPDDAGAAALMLRTLAGDPARRDALGRAQQGRQRASFTIRAQAEATDAVYLRAIAGRRMRGR